MAPSGCSDTGLHGESGAVPLGASSRRAVVHLPTALMRLYVFCVLAAHIVLLVTGVYANFATVDEPGHLSAGLTYWRTGTFSEYRVNPPLFKLLAAAPVYILHPTRTRDDLYAGDGLEMLRLARLTGVFWCVTGGLLVARWAAQLHGPWAGALGLTLWCFDPNVLGHAGLMTPDVPSAVVTLAASYSFWRYLRWPGWGRAAAAGLLLGAAELTKFTLVILYPIWLALWLVHRYRSPDRPRLRTEVSRLALVFGASLVVINAGYLFTGTFRPLSSYRFISHPLAGLGAGHESGQSQPTDSQPVGWPMQWLRSVPVPLPSDYLLGIDEQRAGIQARRENYLCGEWSRDGWWYYYLIGVGVKAPIPLWLLTLWAVGLLVTRRSDGNWPDALVLLLPAACVFLLVSSQTGINRHVRYLFPLLPLVLVFAAQVGRQLRHGTVGTKVAVVGLVLWLVVGTLRVHPHNLSFFNEASGGPKSGHDFLVDSNIDWGQDALALRRWLDENRTDEDGRLGLAYFGALDPRSIGIDYDLPPPGPGSTPRANNRSPREGFGLRPGLYAVSVNFLKGLSFEAPDGRGGRTHVGPFDYLYFLDLEPVASAGYSIYIYRVTEADVRRIRR